MLRALGSASYDLTHETRGTICFGHTRHRVRFVTGIGFCILRYHTRDRGHDLLRALGSSSSDITHETKGTICYGHLVLHLVISYTRQGVRFVTGIGFCVCDITQETEGTMCYGHCAITHETGDILHVVISHTRQRARFVTDIWFCILCYLTQDKGYDLLPPLGSASVISPTEGTMCYGHWVLHLVLSHTRQGVRFVTGIGFCIL